MNNQAGTEIEATELAREFDHTDEVMMRDPWEMFGKFRGGCPVGHSEKLGGFYFATTYDGVNTILNDYETYSSAQGVGIPPMPQQMPPIEQDPPRHTDFRRILNQLFTPRAVAKKRENIEKLVNELIDGIIEKGSADLANEVIRPLMPKIILPIMGVPYEDHEKVERWIERLIFDRVPDPEGAQQAGIEMAMYLEELIASFRENPQGKTDAAHLLLEGEVGGEKLGNNEIARTLTLIMFGGLDTSTAVMAQSIFWLARNPEEKRKLRDGEYVWLEVVDEFIRYTSPLVALRRTLTKDAELEGVKLKKGDRILSVFASANRDESKFENAHLCKLDRADNPHLATGAEHHMCLGRYLARLEIEVWLKTVLDRLYDFEVPDDFVPDYFAGEPRGMKTLPITFSPGKKIMG